MGVLLGRRVPVVRLQELPRRQKLRVVIPPQPKRINQLLPLLVNPTPQLLEPIHQPLQLTPRSSHTPYTNPANPGGGDPSISGFPPHAYASMFFANRAFAASMRWRTRTEGGRSGRYSFHSTRIAQYVSGSDSTTPSTGLPASGNFANTVPATTPANDRNRERRVMAAQPCQSTPSSSRPATNHPTHTPRRVRRSSGIPDNTVPRHPATSATANLPRGEPLSSQNHEGSSSDIHGPETPILFVFLGRLSRGSIQGAILERPVDPQGARTRRTLRDRSPHPPTAYQTVSLDHTTRTRLPRYRTLVPPTIHLRNNHPTHHFTTRHTPTVHPSSETVKPKAQGKILDSTQ